MSCQFDSCRTSGNICRRPIKGDRSATRSSSRLVAALNEEIVRQSQPLEQELVVLLERKEELKTKIEKWEAALEDSPELFPMLKDRLDELTEKRRQLHIRENEILGIFQQGEPIQVKDVQRILTSLIVFLPRVRRSKSKPCIVPL